MVQEVHAGNDFTIGQAEKVPHLMQAAGLIETATGGNRVGAVGQVLETNGLGGGGHGGGPRRDG